MHFCAGTCQLFRTCCNRRRCILRRSFSSWSVQSVLVSSHVPFLPRMADRVSRIFESTLSIFCFRLCVKPNLNADAPACRMRKLIRFYPFRDVFQWQFLPVLRQIVRPAEIAPERHLISLVLRRHQSVTSIFSMQSPQIRLTVFVALTLFPQHGQTYFRVLLRLGAAVSVPLAPLLPALPPVLAGGVHPPPRFIRISVQPCWMM